MMALQTKETRSMSWRMAEVNYFLPFLSLAIIICHDAYCNCGSAKPDDLIDIFNLSFRCCKIKVLIRLKACEAGERLTLCGMARGKRAAFLFHLWMSSAQSPKEGLRDRWQLR